MDFQEKFIDNVLTNSQFKINKYKSNEYYNNINKIIINYCKNNNVVVNNCTDIDNNIYNLYSIKPSKISNDLCNILYNVDKYVSLSTYVYNMVFTIRINNECLINIHLLFIYNNNQVLTNIDFINKDNLLFLPPFVNLIYIYQQLYNPNMIYIYDNDNDMFINQQVNLNNVLTDYNDIKTEKKNYDSIKSKIIKQFINKLDNTNIEHIKLDYYYLLNLQNIMNDKESEIDYNNEFNIIISQLSNLEVIKNILHNLYEKTCPDMKKNTNLIHIQKNNTYILHDFRLQHFKIYLINYNKKYKNYNKILLLNIYNSLDYELIPIHKTLKITHNFVIYRFIFINILNIILYEKSNKFKINYYIDIIKNIEKLLKNNDKIKNIDFKFNGTYKNENFDRILYNKKFKVYPYRPLIYLKTNDSLREIN